MHPHKREQLRRALRSMAEAHAAAIELMEQAFELLREELALDPFTFWRSRDAHKHADRTAHGPDVDHSLLTITYRGRACFLGNTLPLKLFDRLLRRANAYLSYEELLREIWDGVRSDSTVRSAIRTLRTKLRQSGMGDLAKLIDGSVPRHYALKLDRNRK